MLKNKILIVTSILPKEFTHLYGLVDKNELMNNEFYNKIMNFYNNKRDLLLNYNENEKFYSYLKTIKNKYKDKIVIVNQEVDLQFSKLNIEHINLHGNMNQYICLDCNKLHDNKEVCPHCNSNKNFYNIRLKDEKGQYKEIVELLEECQYTIFLGNIGQIDPTLFLDEMVDSLYINIENQKYEGNNPYLEKDLKEKNVDYFFDKSFILNSFDESINEIDNFINLYLSKKDFVNMTNPYKENGKEIVELVNNYFNNLKISHNVENKNYDKKMIKKLKQCYPFIKKLPELYVYNIWFAYCNDTNQNPMNIKYDDLFYDMLLVYSKYKWIGIKKFYTKRPKISLTLAYNDNNEKQIEIFKKLILKKNYY